MQIHKFNDDSAFPEPSWSFQRTSVRHETHLHLSLSSTSQSYRETQYINSNKMLITCKSAIHSLVFERSALTPILSILFVSHTHSHPHSPLLGRIYQRHARAELHKEFVTPATLATGRPKRDNNLYGLVTSICITSFTSPWIGVSRVSETMLSLSPLQYLPRR
jgi:hypothetical protein